MYFFSGKYIINILKVYLKYTEFLQGLLTDKMADLLLTDLLICTELFID